MCGLPKNRNLDCQQFHLTRNCLFFTSRWLMWMLFEGCTMEYVLEAATWHPAQVLNITNTKGTLDYGTDADFVMVSDELDLHATWIAGECVYKDLCQCHKFEVED